MIVVLFSTQCRLFHNFVFFCLNNTFFMYCVLKFQYKPGRLKVNNAFSNSYRVELNDWMTVKNELERIWTEAVVN